MGFPLLPLRLLSYWSTPLFSFYVFGNRNDRAVLGDESVKRGFYDCQAAGVRTRKRAPNRKGERATDGPRGPPAGLVSRRRRLRRTVEKNNPDGPERAPVLAMTCFPPGVSSPDRKEPPLFRSRGASNLGSLRNVHVSRDGGRPLVPETGIRKQGCR